MTTPIQPPTPTPAEVEAAFYAELNAFVISYLAKRGYEGALGVHVDIEALHNMGQAVAVYKPRLLFLRPLPTPETSTNK